jgi:hypothetical protein
MDIKRWRKKAENGSVWAVILKETLVPIMKMKEIHFGWTGRGTLGLRSSPLSKSGCAHTETDSMVISESYFFTFKEEKWNKSRTKQ